MTGVWEEQGQHDHATMEHGGDLATHAVQGYALAQAWVCFRGSDGQIQDSFGIATVTKLGTGQFQVTYSGDFPSNGAVLASLYDTATPPNKYHILNMDMLEVTNDAGTLIDPVQAGMVVFNLPNTPWFS